MADNSIDDPLRYNPTVPSPILYINMGNGKRMLVDGKKLATAAEALGANAYDTLSIGGWRNAAGEFVPDYDSVRIERRHVEDDDTQ